MLGEGGGVGLGGVQLGSPDGQDGSDIGGVMVDGDGDRPPARPREDGGDLEAARTRIAQLEADLADLQATQDLEYRLRSLGAIDVEAAAILVRAVLEKDAAESDGAPLSLEAAIEELRRTRPFLFAASQAGVGGNGAGAMAGYAGGGVGGGVGGGGELDRLAERARTTGDRRTLLKYLRLRRGE